MSEETPMRLAALRNRGGRTSLTRQVALLSLIPIVALGFVLARVLQSQIVTRNLADESQTARLIARIGIQPRITPRELRYGLRPASVHALDQQLGTHSVTQDLARIKVWNAKDTVVYSDQHSLIGRTLKPSDDLENALAGRPNDAIVVTPTPNSETAAEVGLGTLVEVYVPLRFAASGRPVGAFEMYLSYRPVAAAIARAKTMIALLVAIGLTLLWAVIYRIVARASRRLRRQARENYRLARYDTLTGLPNRTMFIERVTEALRGGGSHAQDGAVLSIDLDGFKQINNTLGSDTGDRVLCEVVGRLRDTLGRETLVARLGADEFAMLCPRSQGATGALATAAAVQAALESPIVLDGIALNVEASIGIAATDGHPGEPDALLRHADVALSRARAHGTRVEVYSPDQDTFDPTRLLLLGQVRTALEREEFVLHYQPKISLETGRITGVEALLRWQHPERGLLAPMVFVPLIEQTALVRPVTLYVIDRALRQLVLWRERGIRLNMSVNLSARNLLDPELPSQIFELLHRHGVGAGELTVEVTESATMIDPERAVSVLDALRGGGIGVSIDDFGTGNASIDYLARLPANEIKIDRSFVTDLCDDERAEAIVRSTIDFARHLKLHVVAEGIETQEVLERLTALGCDAGQGFLISRPLPAEQLTGQLGRAAAPSRSPSRGARPATARTPA
jgi:diguanylate cyclase (GGDEF)-like protein